MSDTYEEHVDEASGHAYYINKKSRQSFWTKDEALAHAEESAQAEEANSDVVETAFDSSSGSPYYINKKSRKSFWTISEVTIVVPLAGNHSCAFCDTQALVDKEVAPEQQVPSSKSDTPTEEDEFDDGTFELANIC